MYNAFRRMPTVLELYEKLKPKLGDAEARSLLEFIETTAEQRAASKADLQRTETVLREELHTTVASLREEIHATAASLREEIHTTAASLREEMHKIRAELIKWSFAFWIGNIAVLSGILFALFARGR